MADQTQGQAQGGLGEPISIVGVGCRLPGNISTVEGLLGALRDGRDCITEIPSSRWDVDSFYDPDMVKPGRTYVRKGGFVTDIDRFDASFFRISDAEASRMDPQQRIVLETVWHALENAGQSPDELQHSNTGLFLAMMNSNDYSQLKAAFEGLQGVMGYDAMGDAMSITAGRISHFLGIEGPNFALDAACSGSMVALHLARQSILMGDCDTAIVAGVSAILHPGVHIAFSKVGLMSRAGRCAAFDASADGYIRGEGCVAVVLRRQSVAIDRGDRIMASIVGTAVNQDGRTPALTAPNGRSQEKVIRMALARQGVSPTDIKYVEAHGTGTPVGDPIEMSAIANVFGPGRSSDDPLFVGSVKSNFGHIEAGAGLLGVVKAALSLEKEMIMPSLHFNRLNPNIDLGQAPVKVPTTTIPWPRGQQRRLAGVNSFGYSGTNAHAILQEAPSQMNGHGAPMQVNGSGRPAELVVLSAKTAEGLGDLADRWSQYLAQNDTTSLRDIAFTAATGRAHLRHRLALVGRGRFEINEKLQAWREGRKPKGLHSGQVVGRRKGKIAFVYTGQGAQYAEMGRQLYESETVFADAIDRCAKLMEGQLEPSLKEILFGASSAELLDNTRYVQPAMFALEYALTALLGSWGVEPDFVIGHSIGELTAACVAGVLSLEDAVKFVVARGRLMGELPHGGKMLALDATKAQAREWIRGKESQVSIATVNGPRSVVVSGVAEAVDEVAELAQAEGRRMKALTVSHAFHSPLMDPILDELNQVGASLRMSPAKLPIISNVTGDFMSNDLTGDYWSAHVRQAVLFYEGIQNIVEAGGTTLIEVGPHPALTPAMASALDMSKVQCIPTLVRDQSDVSHILDTVASLYVNGVPLNLDRMFWSPTYRRISLPLYPFRRDRHWLRNSLASDQLPEHPDEMDELHPLVGEVVRIDPRRATYQASLTPTHPWTDHRVLGATVFPATAYLEMAARGYAASKRQEWSPVVLNDVVFERPMVLKYGKAKKVSLTLDDTPSNGTGATSFVVASAGAGAQENYCRGTVRPAGRRLERLSLEHEFGPRETNLEIGPFYGELRKGGLEYGAGFATIRELWTGGQGSGKALGRVALSPHEVKPEPLPHQNAVLLDGCLQVFGAALLTLGEISRRGAFVPAMIESITMSSQLPPQVWSLVNVRATDDGGAALVRIRVLNDEGELLVDIQGLELRLKASLKTAAAGVSKASSGEASNGSGSALTLQSRAELVAHIRGLPDDQRTAALAKWLALEVKDTMGHAAEGLDLENLDPSTAFLEIGLDSLLVTELQRRIQEKLEFRFQPMQGLDYQSIESLAQFILDDVLLAETS